MNKAITDGIVFMPPAFADGLDVWSRGDGVAGSDSYATDQNAAFVPADQDFSGCLEIFKTNAVQKLRYMGQTPIYAGCYLQVKARVKAIAGNFPTVRIAAYAMGAGNAHLASVTEIGPEVTLDSYGEVVEVSAIIGMGHRNGVDMSWGRAAVAAHVGLDLTGPNGGIVRIDDIEVTDITSAFLRDMMNWVDVRDYGAVGDGVTDDAEAFQAADADADGRRVIVPEGVFYLGSDVTLNARVEFEGTVTMPADRMFILTKDFCLPNYIDAFGNEELGFKKAFQALLNNADHESLDMGGRNVKLSEPLDMAAAVPNKAGFATRRVIRNGQFEAEGVANWATETVTSQASYDPADARTLSNVVNVANVPVGSLVTGVGVGREVYVRSVNVAQGTVSLNSPLYDAAGTQVFTFQRFKYLLDFSGFSQLSKFSLSDIEFQCSGVASGILLAPSGITFHLRDCFISRPLDRGLTSIGSGCQGMLIDRCQFLSFEDGADVADRKSIVLNAASNDVKLRNNRATRFRHFAVLGGANNLILGNHFFQGDSVVGGPRTAGIVLAGSYTSSIVNGNYVDNCFIEWTNEYDPSPDFTGGFSFSALSVSDNIFLSSAVAPWFSYIVVKPHGAGHFLNGVNVTGNRFRSVQGSIDRAERVDTSFSDLDYSRFKDVSFTGNSYHNVTMQVTNPIRIIHAQNTAASTWTVDPGGLLPFGGYSRAVDAVTVAGHLKDGAGVTRYDRPNVFTEQGADKDEITLRWPVAVTGEATVIMRIDR